MANDGSIKNYTNKYLQSGGALELMKMVVGDKGLQDEQIGDWIVEKAADICAREGSWLTDRASKGPNFDDAEFLRVKSTDLNVKMLHKFRIGDLRDRYERVTPRLQVILKAVVGKTEPEHAGSRNPDMGRTLVTSMLLNLRSHLTSYHGAMNALMLWDNRAPKKLVHILSRYGFSSSYSFLQKSVSQVSSDAIKIAIRAANDPSKITMLPYDNFNWTNHAWETSATHGTVTHDQVSALLVVLPCPPNTTAAALTSITNFESTIRTRHRLPAHQSLSEILPDQADQSAFFQNSVLHIAHILAEGVKSWAAHRSKIPDFFDPHALPACKSEEYFLPTYDQEQSSTRGNMLVIGHYYTDILRMPKSLFEQRNYFLLGDRLTTARARAAQDQRALDRSEDRIDNLSSFETLSGIMHVCMNQVNNIGKNAWGGEDRDSVSLQTLLSKLPNRSDINLRKIDFYAWLRFLDVVLRALVLKAAMTILHLQSPAELGQRFTHEGFMSLCTQISSQLLMPSVDKLEAEGIKKLLGHTASGHAVLLMHDLMTIREMCHAVKHGHPDVLGLGPRAKSRRERVYDAVQGGRCYGIRD
ncbi:hypothetical protein C8J57DRAFT_1594584 [Mycena rebaudengoi]|nr:hypothetical protein C8J57DRAFT_1594584 [Mycena rebaudengoi]